MRRLANGLVLAWICAVVLPATVHRQALRQVRPQLRRSPRPVRVGRHAGAFALHPDQPEIPPSGPERHVAFVQ